MNETEIGRLREGVEALADEWEREARRREADVRDLRADGKDYSVTLRHERLCAHHATDLRALLHADIESEAGA